MTQSKRDSKYYINVAEIMQLKTPRCRLQKPRWKLGKAQFGDEIIEVILW